MAKLRENKSPLKSPTGEDKKERKKPALCFQSNNVGVRVNTKTFPGIPKELAYIILGLNPLHIAVIELLLKC